MNAPAFHLVRPPVAVAPLLSVKNVSLEYRTEQRTVRATHDVSFDVFRGDRFVLLGPSGCGKSSLLKAVAGFIAPRTGSIAMQGQPIHQPGPDRVVVFQEFDQLPPWKTVLENGAGKRHVPLAGQQASRQAGGARARPSLDCQGGPGRL